MNLTEQQLSSETIFSGKVVALQRDEVLLPNGKTSAREVVRHPGGVAVAALDEQRRLYLVRQFRYPLGKTTLEIPAGKRDIKGETPEETGRRELLEECGLRAGTMHSLGSVYPTVGFCDEEIFLFWTDDFTEETQNPDEDEFVEVIKLPLAEVAEMIMRGEIKDGKTVAAVLKLSQLSTVNCQLSTD